MSNPNNSNINNINMTNNILNSQNSSNYSRDYSEYLARINCCSNKFLGPVGEVGMEGFIGATGAMGLTGMLGADGPTGPTGLWCTGHTGPTGKGGVDKGPTGPTGSIRPLIYTAGDGIDIINNPNTVISLAPDGIDGSYNIAPDTTFSWNVNRFGHSIVALPPNRTSLNMNFIDISTVIPSPINPTIFTDVFGYRYNVYVCTSDTRITMTNPAGGYVNMCIIGGGGGGGGCSLTEYAGGASAGQLMFVDNFFMANGTYNVSLGLGGDGGTSSAIFATSGNPGTPTVITDVSTNAVLFSSAGGLGGVVGSGNYAQSGIDGSYCIYNTYSSVTVGTSSGGGGSSSETNYGNAVRLLYKDAIRPNDDLSAQAWSCGYAGGHGSFGFSGGGGGGAGSLSTIAGIGGVGQNGTATNGGRGGQGNVIYFDASYGRAVCGGGDGGGATPNSYTSVPYNPSAYLYNYNNSSPPSGYPPIYSYGAGTINPLHIDAYPNTGSAGAPGYIDSSLNYFGGGNGGSGLFMLRYQLF